MTFDEVRHLELMVKISEFIKYNFSEVLKENNILDVKASSFGFIVDYYEDDSVIGDKGFILDVRRQTLSLDELFILLNKIGGNKNEKL